VCTKSEIRNPSSHIITIPSIIQKILTTLFILHHYTIQLNTSHHNANSQSKSKYEDGTKTKIMLCFHDGGRRSCTYQKDASTTFVYRTIMLSLADDAASSSDYDDDFHQLGSSNVGCVVLSFCAHAELQTTCEALG